MQSDFGPAEFVEADGWFALETGPWLYSNERSSLNSAADAPQVGHLKSLPGEPEREEERRARERTAADLRGRTGVRR